MVAAGDRVKDVPGVDAAVETSLEAVHINKVQQDVVESNKWGIVVVQQVCNI